MLRLLATDISEMNKAFCSLFNAGNGRTSAKLHSMLLYGSFVTEKVLRAYKHRKCHLTYTFLNYDSRSHEKLGLFNNEMSPLHKRKNLN